MPWANYHTHCSFCHGEGEPEDYVLEAIKKGFRAIGFSPHAPMPFVTDWHVGRANFENYVATVNALKGRYNYRIEIYCGLELDWYTENNSDSYLLNEVDYHIGSVHYLIPFPDKNHFVCDYNNEIFADGLNQIYKGSIERLVDDYYSRVEQMLQQRKPDLIGHLELVAKFNRGNKYFNPKEKWYIERIEKTLALIKKIGGVVELNTRSLYKGLVEEGCPSNATLKMCCEREIPVSISSDAHSPRDLDAGFEQMAKELLKIGYKELNILYQGRWQKVKFNASGLKI